MTTLHNEIRIKASKEKLWNTLSNLEVLGLYDPVVRKASKISSIDNGIGASRKCDCSDGKNWFEEKITEWKPNEAITFEITNCSIPMKFLEHKYKITEHNGELLVKQTMNYKMKFGILGALMDKLMVKKNTDDSIKKFFNGLKDFVELNRTKENTH